MINIVVYDEKNFYDLKISSLSGSIHGLNTALTDYQKDFLCLKRDLYALLTYGHLKYVLFPDRHHLAQFDDPESWTS